MTTLRVGQLREALRNLPEDTHVHVEVATKWARRRRAPAKWVVREIDDLIPGPSVLVITGMMDTEPTR